MEHAHDDDPQPGQHGSEPGQPHEGCGGYTWFAFCFRDLAFGIHLFSPFEPINQNRS
jgi:hypothetical protein